MNKSEEDMESFEVISKIMIKTPGKKATYGPGIDTLIREIQKTGSLNKASKAMGMSYSKAWKLVNSTEEMLGFDLIDRHQGARGSDLTKEAKDLLNFYTDLDNEVRTTIEKVKNKYINKF